MSARFAMGVGVGALLMGILNASRDPPLAVSLLGAGAVFVAAAAAGHWRLGRALDEA
jgi:hypothetical protein